MQKDFKVYILKENLKSSRHMKSTIARAPETHYDFTFLKQHIQDSFVSITQYATFKKRTHTENPELERVLNIKQ
ncbi:hypothetical protein MFLAVUS_005292 [Mucor flavus]|uniref:Uncharacterized protein n=1 Tax=Mucor flavus TaxID=439312 RepID=A0ABP9YYB1_9FUNG